ncbi:MAG: phospho-N-acetylmuramoyl-pentapeptide-transferase, partial [Anaerolineae bacterium]|nr:phospho-N-acetylmuramoyl-pentapeptide-transferase [Anaerolineae bacterium]
AALVLYFALDVQDVKIPWAGQFDLGLGYIPLAVIIVVFTTTSVAITDGLDGLAGGAAALAFLAYGVI